MTSQNTTSKNILFVIDSMGIGGAEKVVLTLAKSLLDSGNSVHLIICDKDIKFMPDSRIKLHILRFKKSFMDYKRYSIRLHKLITSIEKKDGFKFDLIVAHLQKSTRLLRGCKHENIYHVVHSTLSKSAFANRSGLRLWLKKRNIQKIYYNLNIIAVSDGIKEDLLENIGIKPRSIQTIYNPINIDELKQLSKEKLAVDKADYIVHVGRFDTQKRHDILLKAFVKSKLGIKLILIGDGAERENITKLIKKLGIEDRVILTGFIQNPYPIIKNAKMLVLTSDYEGFGVVLAEALALNTPVVSTDCASGPNEILTGENRRYLARVGDVDDIANKLKEIYQEVDDIVINMPDKFDNIRITKQYLMLSY